MTTMTARNLFIGLDPGKTGAIAVINHYGIVVAVDDMPSLGGEVDAAGVMGIIREFADRVAAAAIERTQAMPQTPRTVCHSLGLSEGLALAAFSILGVPLYRPRPAAWKKIVGVSADKEEARAMAAHRFPHAKARLARKSDHNRAEALLLADYARVVFTKGAGAHNE